MEALPADAFETVTAPPGLPAGRYVELPERGTTYVREAAGPAGAPTVLLLHGWTASSALNWFRSYETLSMRFNVVAIDHRGHGRGIRSRKPFTLEDCADDAAALVDELGIGSVVAAGYSMGGPVAQLLWRRHPDKVRGLVLCATARNFIGTSRPERMWLGAMSGLAVAARAAPPGVRRRLQERVVGGRLDGESPLAPWALSELRLNDGRMLVEAGRAIAQFTSGSWIGEVDVPTAVVVTEQDLVVHPMRQHKLAAAIPGATMFRVPGGHDSAVMLPEVFGPKLVEACAHAASRPSRP